MNAHTLDLSRHRFVFLPNFDRVVIINAIGQSWNLSFDELERCLKKMRKRRTSKNLTKGGSKV